MSRCRHGGLSQQNTCLTLNLPPSYLSGCQDPLPLDFCFILSCDVPVTRVAAAVSDPMIAQANVGSSDQHRETPAPWDGTDTSDKSDMCVHMCVHMPVCLCACVHRWPMGDRRPGQGKGDPLTSWDESEEESRKNRDERGSGLGKRRPDFTSVIVPICLRFSQR